MDCAAEFQAPWGIRSTQRIATERRPNRFPAGDIVFEENLSIVAATRSCRFGDCYETNPRSTVSLHVQFRLRATTASAGNPIPIGPGCPETSSRFVSR